MPSVTSQWADLQHIDKLFVLKGGICRGDFQRRKIFSFFSFDFPLLCFLSSDVPDKELELCETRLTLTLDAAGGDLAAHLWDIRHAFAKTCLPPQQTALSLRLSPAPPLFSQNSFLFHLFTPFFYCFFPPFRANCSHLHMVATLHQ